MITFEHRVALLRRLLKSPANVVEMNCEAWRRARPQLWAASSDEVMADLRLESVRRVAEWRTKWVQR